MPIASVRGEANHQIVPQTFSALPPMVVNTGDDLVVGVSIADTSVSVTSITDTAGNTFRLRQFSSNDGNVRAELWEAQGVFGNPADIVVVNLSGSSLVTVIVWEFSGVKVEAYPSPQDIASSTGTNIQVTCGAAAQGISSWVIGIFGYVNPYPLWAGLISQRGTLLQVEPSSDPSAMNIGLAMMYVRPYASGVGPPGFVVPTPIALLTGFEVAPQPFAGVTLELRATEGPGGGGGTTPANPPWTPPPTGTLVGFSYTFTVEASAPAAATSADVTCSYLQSVCDDGSEAAGNDAY